MKLAHDWSWVLGRHLGAALGEPQHGLVTDFGRAGAGRHGIRWRWRRSDAGILFRRRRSPRDADI